MPLTDIKIKNANPNGKQVKLFDSDGLYLLVTPLKKRIGKRWRFKYRFQGKEKLLALGTYPDVSLARARSKRDEARQLLADGIDPGKAKQEKKALLAEEQFNTFQKLTEDWLLHRQGSLADSTLKMIERRLRKDVFPIIGTTPLSELTPKTILEKVLLPIEARGAQDLVHRIRSTISQILRYGVAKGFCDRDFTVDLRGALKPNRHKHLAAFDNETGSPDPQKVAMLLRAIDSFTGSFVVKNALKLHPFVATRPGELRQAEWVEIDFKNKMWSIPAGRMKMKNPHLVPLSEQAVSILRDLHTVTGSGKYLFPSLRSTSKPISDNAMNAALRSMGIPKEDFVSHGWRAIFRTLADEVLHERLDIIEAQLAHQVKDPLGRAYNRTSFLKERRELMEKWGDYLMVIKG